MVSSYLNLHLNVSIGLRDDSKKTRIKKQAKPKQKNPKRQTLILLLSTDAVTGMYQACLRCDLSYWGVGKIPWKPLNSTVTNIHQDTGYFYKCSVHTFILWWTANKNYGTISIQILEKRTWK